MTRRERLERKLEKREEWAGKARARSEARLATASTMADRIPLGQPILAGHHSEKRDRAYRERIHNNMSRGVEEAKLADHHAAKADGIERILDTNIFDDDPDAIEKLEARIAEREKNAERMKQLNKIWRKGGVEALKASGLCSEKLAETTAETMRLCPWLKTPFDTTGERAAIRRDKERIAQIKNKRERAAKAEAAGGVLIEGDTYVRVTFPEKPAREVLDALRAAGFRWSSGSWFGEREKLPALVSS